MKKAIKMVVISMIMILCFVGCTDKNDNNTVTENNTKENNSIENNNTENNSTENNTEEITTENMEEIPDEFHWEINGDTLRIYGHGPMPKSGLWTEKEFSHVIIEEGITSISESAFYQCRKLISVKIPETVTTIENAAFANCYDLIDVTIPKSVTSFGSYAFGQTAWLDKKRAENPLVIVNNIVLDGQKCKGEVIIPESVIAIGKSAFSYNEYITNITIPESVTSIGSHAFIECKGITSIIIPTSVTSVEEYTFNRCTNLTSVTIPESVTNISALSFTDTPWLESKQAENPLVIINNILIDGVKCEGDIIIPDGVTCIQYLAFYQCDKLISVTIPESVTSIGYSAFYECENFTAIYGKAGSYAEKFANTYEYTFIAK